MEAIYGKLWETNKVSDLNKYHELRKIKPLENGLEKYNIHCWASGVRAGQTENRNKMRFWTLFVKKTFFKAFIKLDK